MTNKFLIFSIIFFSIMTPVCAQSSIETGEKYLKENQIKKAKKVFVEHQDNIKAIEYLGDIAGFEKRWDDAINYYEKLLETKPDSPKYNFKLGGAMGMKALEISKFKAALMIGDIKTYLNKAAELDKNHAEARRVLVELYMQLPAILGGGKDVAEKFKAELHNINKVDAHLAEAYIHKYEGNDKLMEDAIKNALQQALNNKKLVERNYQNYELGERAAALKIMPDASIYFLQEYAENYNYKDLKSPAWAHYHIAQVQARQNNQDKALSHINKALANKFNFPEAEKLKQQILEM
ncbi:hypothetical protein LB465_01230 [Salegentibacter sp. LM13S]|uniref:tetratricopeptide repeat protein n=1 Tax=Salegentibacter lacus TaxID=2873599 RepID=UPI001CCAB094|nr:hypothetical protein [Salegentibacter lacus]MBZ9629383.1 hypothetical protein [Salegentibacter lacus]